MPELQSLTAPRFLPTSLAPEHAEEEALSAAARRPIGWVTGVSGSGAQVLLDATRLARCMAEGDAALATAGQVGSPVKIRTRSGWLLASVRDQRRASADAGSRLAPAQALPSPWQSGDLEAYEEHGQGVEAQVDFLGEGLEDSGCGRIHGFRRGVTRYPIPGAEVYAATSGDLRQIYAGDGREAITIGTVYPTHNIRAGLYVDPLLGRHFALLGSTGTGKSTALALILHRICEAAPNGHVVMIDPHGEYGAAFRDKGEVFDVANLRMPYWLMNFEEHCEVLLQSRGEDHQIDRDILARCLLAARQGSRLAEGLGRVTVDSPIPYLLSDLTRLLSDAMGKLDKATNSAPYVRIKSKIEELRADPRYAFMFSGMLVGDTMAEFVSRVFRLPGEGRPIAIIDVSGVPSDITRTVVAVLSRMVFDFAVWGREEATRPILLVCEEAHRYVPGERVGEGGSVAKILSRIAKEGRKYGIALGLVTQRPSDLAEGVLSQCGTMIVMRLNNERDQAFVRAAMPEGARGFLDSIPALRNRECVICGEGVSIPIRASFDDLEEARRPASDDPSFARLWHSGGGEAEMVERVVRRWRAQGR